MVVGQICCGLQVCCRAAPYVSCVDPELEETKHRFAGMHARCRWCLSVKAVSAPRGGVLRVQNDEQGGN